MVKDEYMSRGMDMEGVGHPQSQMGMNMPTPGVSGVGSLPPHQPPPQTIQHHGPPPTPTFSTMMVHPSQNQGQSNELNYFFPVAIVCLFNYIVLVPPSSPTSPPHNIQQQVQQQQQHNAPTATPTPQGAPPSNSGQVFFGNDMPPGNNKM